MTVNRTIAAALLVLTAGVTTALAQAQVKYVK